MHQGASVKTQDDQVEVLVEGSPRWPRCLPQRESSSCSRRSTPSPFQSYPVLGSATALDRMARTGRSSDPYQVDWYHTVLGSDDPITVARAGSGTLATSSSRTTRAA